MAGVGLCARAMVYVLLGVLVAQIAARGRSSGPADTPGAFSTIAAQPAGRDMLAVVAAGLAAYAVWRFVEAASPTPQGSRASAWARVGWGAAGILYVALCADAVRLVAGARQHSPEQHPASFASRLLELPAGSELLGLVATAVAAGGAGLVVWGVLHDYRHDLRRRAMSPRAQQVAVVSAVVGNAARGLAALLVAASIFGSAVSGDPARAESLDAALRSLARGPAGGPLLSLLALGFFGFALFSVAEARYRRL